MSWWDLSAQEAGSGPRRPEGCLEPEEATVLVIDDSLMERTLLTRALESLDWPAHVACARDGAEGVRAVEGMEGPVIVLSDFHMPGADGAAVARRLRLDDRTATMPVFIVSNTMECGDIRRAMRAGANGFFCKPADAGDVLGLIKLVHAFALKHCFPGPEGGPQGHA